MYPLLQMDKQNKAQPKHILILAIQNDNNTNNYNKNKTKKNLIFTLMIIKANNE